VVEDIPIMSAKYRLSDVFGQNCPMLRSSRTVSLRQLNLIVLFMMGRVCVTVM